MPNAKYAPKLEYFDILVKMVDISELVCNDIFFCELKRQLG